MNATEAAPNIFSAFLFHKYNLTVMPFSKLNKCPYSFHDRNEKKANELAHVERLLFSFLITLSTKPYRKMAF